jgi:ABC-type uncharacterized transport system involved in gliding motility auxiliary subunit
LAATDEQALVSVILKLTRDKLKTVCFVTGHEEKSITDVDGDGYALVGRVLKGENYDTKSINLTESAQVPSECAVLAIAGPKKTFLPQETSAVGKYLDEGGKVFLLIDPDVDAGLGDLLKVWNIGLGPDTVVDPTNGVGHPVVQSFPDHAITKDMKRSAAFFPFARSVKGGGGGGGAAPITDILTTSPRSWAETDLKSGSAKFDEGKDTRGPISIGVAADKKMGDKDARLVVYGDSDFATNTYIANLSNGDLFFNTVNWLAQDEDLISIRSKDPTKRKINVDDFGRRLIMLITTIGMPLAAVVAGLYVWSERR